MTIQLPLLQISSRTSIKGIFQIFDSKQKVFLYSKWRESLTEVTDFLKVFSVVTVFLGVTIFATGWQMSMAMAKLTFIRLLVRWSC